MSTVNVTSASGSPSFPFNGWGEWEKSGVGFSQEDGGFIATGVGSIDSQPWDFAINAAGTMSAFNSFILVTTGSDPPSWTEVAVTLYGGSTNTYTLSDPNLTITTSSPPCGGTSTVVYEWFDGNTDFVASEVTQLVFNDPAPSPSVSIDPTSATVVLGQTQDFTATTGNPSGASVTWSCLYGTVGNGIYTAPDSYLYSYDTVTVALFSDPSVYATAAVYLDVPTVEVNAGYRSPAQVGPVMITKAASINPKVYMPVEDTTVKNNEYLG